MRVSPGGLFGYKDDKTLVEVSVGDDDFLWL